jgi:hypothetical protein
MNHEIKVSPTQSCKDRVAAVRDNLPKNYNDQIVWENPEYDSRKGYVLIKNVKALKTADLKLTEIFEKLAKRKSIILLVEGSETTLEDFIKENTAPDVEPITKQEIDSLDKLAIGECVHLGMCEVKRML